ncbi:hypothetical protein BPNPMPFG_005428 [Mesorhizobium sp. AR07]|uniref:hypothetical protein n=1 Tax=Mesorhizobium sp. AR07 TaxID=2865838 RepID=UPI00215F0D13|nr:hypothetical protein [Mesorhizobium sp. AR07]UVK43619.1 hypothetical protein BPNPMPFG_005428 [Mesorhizobium sp. AR07]
MANPKHFSVEIPTRCLDLIDLLFPVVEKDKGTAQKHDGPLSTTFLLAMAIPMIVLPVERLLKDFGPDAPDYANDSGIAPEVTGALGKVVARAKLRDTDIFETDVWAFVQGNRVFNLANPFPKELAAALSSGEAFGAASGMSFRQFLMTLRNALSHGGIMYLDEDGLTSERQTSMLAFVSARLKYDECEKCHQRAPQLVGLNDLRISESGFRRFLTRWTAWLQSTPLHWI